MFSKHKKNTKMIRRVIFNLFLFMLFLLPFSLTAPEDILVEKVKASKIDSRAEALIEAINLEREKFNLGDLYYNQELGRLAEIRAIDMIENNYIDHINPQNENLAFFASRVNYSYLYIGENLAIDYIDPSETVEAWLASPAHRDNLLKPEYDELGIAFCQVVKDGQSKLVTILILGKQRKLSWHKLLIR